MSQNDKLLEALQTGATLTPYNALQIAGTLRLSERCRELSAEGVPIEKGWLKTGKTRVRTYKLGAIAHG